jgi:hypothetical protein
MLVTLKTVTVLATEVVIQVCAWNFMSVRLVGVELFLEGNTVERKNMKLTVAFRVCIANGHRKCSECPPVTLTRL